MSGSDFDNGFYASLEPSARAIVMTAEKDISDQETNESAGTFRKGDALCRTRTVLPERTFKRWCQTKFTYSRDYAYKLMRVSSTLDDWRKRLIASRVPRKTLIDLAGRPERTEDVLRLFENGMRPSVETAKRIIVREEEKQSLHVGSDDRGGPKGLRALHAEKGRFIPVLLKRIAWIAREIQQTLEQSQAGNRLRKGALAQRIVHPARLAHRELESICLHVVPDDLDPAQARSTSLPEGSRWQELSDALFALGGKETWPAHADLADWLSLKVLPLLRWAGDKEVDGPAPLKDRRLQNMPAAAMTDMPAAIELSRPGLGTFARDKLKIDPHRFCLPQSEARYGSEYEVELTGETGRWLQARLSQDRWVAASRILDFDMVANVRMPEDMVRLAIDFLVYIRRYVHRQGGDEELADATARGVASSLMELMGHAAVPALPGKRQESCQSLVENLLQECKRAAQEEIAQSTAVASH